MLAHFIDSKTFQCGYFQDRESLFEEYLLEDISEGRKYMKVYKQMKMYNDEELNPVLRNKR